MPSSTCFGFTKKTPQNLNYVNLNSATANSIVELMTTENLVTAPVGTNLEQARSILQQHKIEKLPVVDDNNKLVNRYNNR